MLYLLSPKRIEMTTQARWSRTTLSIDLITSNMDHFSVETARACQRAHAGACVRINTRLSLTIPASARAFPGAVSLQRVDSVHWLSSTESVLVCRTEQKLCSDLAGSSALAVCLPGCCQKPRNRAAGGEAAAVAPPLFLAKSHDSYISPFFLL